jgi:hypothetical protein
MKIFVPLFVVLAAVAVQPVIAAADQTPGQPAAQPAQVSPERKQEMDNRKAEENLRFEHRKAEQIKEMDDRIAEMKLRMDRESQQMEREKQRMEAEMQRLEKEKQHMGDALAAHQKKRDCVQAAADMNALKACMGWPEKHGNQAGHEGDTPAPNGEKH